MTCEYKRIIFAHLYENFCSTDARLYSTHCVYNKLPPKTILRFFSVTFVCSHLLVIQSPPHRTYYEYKLCDKKKDVISKHEQVGIVVGAGGYERCRSAWGCCRNHFCDFHAKCHCWSPPPPNVNNNVYKGGEKNIFFSFTFVLSIMWCISLIYSKNTFEL